MSALKAQCLCDWSVCCIVRDQSDHYVVRLRSSLRAAGPRREEDRSDIRVTVVEMHSGVGFKSVLEIQHHCLNGPFDTSGADSHHRYE